MTCGYCNKIECPCEDRLMQPRMNKAMAMFRAVSLAHKGVTEVGEDKFTFWGTGPKWIVANAVAEVQVGCHFYADGVVMVYRRFFDDGVIEREYGGSINYEPIYTTLEMSELRREAADYATKGAR